MSPGVALTAVVPGVTAAIVITPVPTLSKLISVPIGKLDVVFVGILTVKVPLSSIKSFSSPIATVYAPVFSATTVVVLLL